ncbi:MAG: hypothetical protein JKP95_00915 [Oceanicaulis sp.]|nr:hypothetical protein [Oceanicaulis sp.]
MDADGDELTITAITQPDNGDSATIAADGQSIHYNPLTTPADGAMTYTVSDGRGGFATGAIALLANSPQLQWMTITGLKVGTRIHKRIS